MNTNIKEVEVYRDLDYERRLLEKYKRKLRLERKLEDKNMKKYSLKNKKEENKNNKSVLVYKLIGVLALAILIMFTVNNVVFGAEDPLSVINNLSEFIFGLIRAVGMIILGFGIVQVGLSLKSHDPSQRANGLMTLAGGVVITFTKEILTLITGG